MSLLAPLRELDTVQRHTVLASFLGWTLDAFDYFLLTFVIVTVAKEFENLSPGWIIKSLKNGIHISILRQVSNNHQICQARMGRGAILRKPTQREKRTDAINSSQPRGCGQVERRGFPGWIRSR